MSLGDLGCGHAGVGCIREHEEQICVKRSTDALAHILDIGQQVVQVEIHLKRGLDAHAGTIHERDATGQRFHVPILHARWNLKRRLRLVVDGLRLAKLLVLELLDISKSLHAWAVSVDVAAGSSPTRHKRREVREPALTQEHAILASDLKVPRSERHVLAIALGHVSVHARLNSVDHGNPRIKRACVVHVLHASRTVVVTKFLDHLTDRHLKLSVERADSALRIC